MEGMLAALPLLLLVFGTPIAVLAVIPAGLLWNRLYRGRGRGLSALYLTEPGAAGIASRLRGAGRSALAALAVTTSVAVAGVVLAFAAAGADGRLAAVVGPVAALAGVLVLLAWPVPRPLDAPAPEGFVPLSRPERRSMTLVGALGGLLGAIVIAAGLVSVPDVPSPHYRAFPQASVVEWWYTYDGFPKDLEYTLHGVTAPWPGWWYGVPVLAAGGLLVAAALAALLRVHRLPAAAAASREADDVVRMLLGTVAVALAAAGLLTPMAFVLTMIGDVFTSISLFPKPKIDPYGMLKPVGYTQPLHAVGLVAQWSWAVLGVLALAAVWVAVFAARELAGGADAARRVLRRAGERPRAVPGPVASAG